MVETILVAAALLFKRNLRGLRGAVAPPELFAALEVRRWTVCIAAVVIVESDKCLLQLQRRVKDEGRGVYVWEGCRLPDFPEPRSGKEAAQRVTIRCTVCRSIRPLDYMVY